MDTADSSDTRFLDVAGAAAHLDVSEAFIRRIVLEKRVRYYKVGRLLRFRAADLEAFAEAGRTEPVPDDEYSVRGRAGSRRG